MQTQPGYITLLSIIILGAVGSLIIATMVVIGVGQIRSSIEITQSLQSQASANACTEEALEKIRENTAFTGSGTLNFAQGSCFYQVTSGVGQARTINASSTPLTIVRKVRVNLDTITPKIHITSWKEVAL